MTDHQSQELVERITHTKQQLWELQQQAMEAEFAGLSGQAILCRYADDKYIAIDTRNIQMVAQSMEFDGAADRHNAMGTIDIDGQSTTIYDLSAIMGTGQQSVSPDGYFVILRYTPIFGLYLSDILDVETFDPAAIEFEMQGDTVSAFAHFSVGQAFLYNPLSILMANET